VLAPGNVAQEMDRFTVIRESYAKEILKDPLEDWLIAHELSHQWWGNNVTCADWADFWLNEGMATFMTAAYKEKRWGRDEYDREIELSRRSYQQLRDAHKDRPLAYEHPIAESAAGGSIVYDKGALMLHLLRCYLGEKAFWEGIRQYTRKNFGGSVTSRNLQSAMETASGESLASFFDKWIYSAGPPSLVARHRIDNGELIVEVEQQQPDPWPVPIKVAVETKSGRQTKQLLLTTKRGELRFRIVDAPLSVRIDDGGFLPFTVSHERPVTMLFYQLGHEPDLAGRIEAMDRLKELTSKAPEVRQQFRAALRERAEKDSSRLVRTLAQKEL
jgi:aminopeptidase N